MTTHGIVPGRAERVHPPSLADDPALGLSHRAKLEILGAVLLALFLGALDQTIVGTALPTIVTDLGGNEYYDWVVTIYLLTSTITVPFYGKLSDLYGRKPMLMIGIAIFLIGSALSGLSQNMAMLILFRGIQGLGAGALFPISLAVIGDLFTPAERGKYQGLFGAVFGISFIVGPALGGLPDRQRQLALDLLRQPAGRPRQPVRHLAAAADHQAPGRGPQPRLPRRRRLHGRHQRAPDRPDQQAVRRLGRPVRRGPHRVRRGTLPPSSCSSSRAKEPIVPLDLWRNRTYAASIISTFLVSFGFFGAIIFLPRWFQFVRTAPAPPSPAIRSLALLVGLIVSSIISGILVSRTGKYKWIS